MAKLVCVEDFKKNAISRLSHVAHRFYCEGAGDEDTLHLNYAAFKKLRIRPRMLRGIQDVDTGVIVQGEHIDFPVGIAPTALHKLCHSEGECATAKGAQQKNTIYCLSTSASSTIEQVASAAPNGLKWYQLYMSADRKITEKWVSTAAKHGFRAVVLTVDLPVLGNRREFNRDPYKLPDNVKHAFINDEGVTSVMSQFKGDLSWDDVKWLRSLCKINNVKLILKGILTAEDAIIARDLDVDGIIVSNHGGRQLDSAPATIEVLPEVVRAVGQDIEVYVDGGITQGTEIFKALALGAKMVFIGRATLWGLACDGANGVQAVLDILKQELINTMILSGCQNIKEINKNHVVHESYYHKL